MLASVSAFVGVAQGAAREELARSPLHSCVHTLRAATPPASAVPATYPSGAPLACACVCAAGFALAPCAPPASVSARVRWTSAMMQVSAADMREFAKYDHDQSSFLDMAEFIAALKADRFNKQVSDEEAMEIFKMADIDGDGKISMNEFHTMKSLNLSTGRREHLSLSHSPTLALSRLVCV